VNNRQQPPLGILLIAGFYTFGSLILLASLFIHPNEVSRQIAMSQGLPISIGVSILPLTAAVGLLIAYGLFSLSPWGFFFTPGQMNLLLLGALARVKRGLTHGYHPSSVVNYARSLGSPHNILLIAR
jgi:hypothetical protein